MFLILGIFIQVTVCHKEHYNVAMVYEVSLTKQMFVKIYLQLFDSDTKILCSQ